MPAVSKAQFKKMFELEKEGKITKEQLDKFVSTVEYSKLPKRKRKKGKKK